MFEPENDSQSSLVEESIVEKKKNSASPINGVFFMVTRKDDAKSIIS